MKVIAFKVEEELLNALDIYALNKRMTRSEVIRNALKKYLEEEPPTGLEPATTGFPARGYKAGALPLSYGGTNE
ncbi:hypothetical protein GCM10007116_10800 [Sulfodiicoccus acidiphilus]|uniref:Ribbon-helix-helix protein CopG domain-containing protein n=1 Tax=Sulfodiicoccus acidiphilus TaxID=1670455 RepID=A0A830H3H7_9CREN|nr:hypothetical protein GCM10007116_10800 [Sulfodiicoccus acidiphilus]